MCVRSLGGAGGRHLLWLRFKKKKKKSKNAHVLEHRFLIMLPSTNLMEQHVDINRKRKNFCHAPVGRRASKNGPIEGTWRGRGHGVAFVVVLLTGIMVIV